MARLEQSQPEADSSTQDIVECLNHILDQVILSADDRAVGGYDEKDGFYIIDRSTFRTKNTDVESVIGERIICADADEDSEEEFNNILETCRRMRQKELLNEDDDEDVPSVPCATDARLVEHEYDNFPAIAELLIHVDEGIKLKKLGKITQIVDCLVVVQCDSNVALDFDSVVFDENRNAIGQVFDIFGAVASPLYSIRFNSCDEAKQHPVGKSVFFAPDAEQYTHSIFTDQLKSLKITDSCWDGEGECPDDQLAFSDDEAEKSYMAKKRRKKQNISCRQDASTSEPANKKGEFGRGGYVPRQNVGGRNGPGPGPKRGRFSPQFSRRPFERNPNSENDTAQSSGFRGAWPPTQMDGNRGFVPRPHFRRGFGRGNNMASAAPHNAPLDMRGQTGAFVFGQQPNFDHTWVGPRRPHPQFVSSVAAGAPASGSSFLASGWSGSQNPETSDDQPIFVDTRFVQD